MPRPGRWRGHLAGAQGTAEQGLEVCAGTGGGQWGAESGVTQGTTGVPAQMEEFP